MSNETSYTLYYDVVAFKEPSLFSHFINIFQSQGFLVWNSDHKITAMDCEGASVQTTLLSDVYTLLQKGGLIVLWKHAANTNTGEDIHLSVNSTLRTVSFGVSYTLTPNDRAIADDLFVLFTKVCQETTPYYAYSADELSLEMAFKPMFVEQYKIFNTTVLERKPPAFLFWLNYFDERYYQEVDLHIRKMPSHRTISLQVGRMIMLSDYPWNIPIASRRSTGHYEPLV